MMVETSRIGDSLGLSVPDSLLRTHESSGATRPTERAREVPRADPPRLRPLLSATPHLALLASIAAAGVVVDGSLVVFASHLRRSLGTTEVGIVGLLVTVVAARLVAGVVIGPLSRRVGPWPIIASGAAAGAVLTPLLALPRSVSMAAVIAVLVGVAGAPMHTVHLAVLAEGSPPEGRARVYATHAGGALVARGVGAAVLAGLADVVGWRPALLVALLGLPLAVLAARVRQPELSAAAPSDEAGGAARASSGMPRLARTGSRNLLTVGLALAGFAALGLPFTVRSLLEQRHVAIGSQGTVDVVAVIIALVGVPIAGRLGDLWAAADRSRLALLIGGGVATFGLAAGLGALVRQRLLFGAIIGVGLAGLVVAVIVLLVIISEVVAGPTRVAAFGLAGGLAALWGLTAALVASGAGAAWGAGSVLGFVALAGVAAAVVIVIDRDEVVEDIVTVAIEAEDRAQTASDRRAGRASPALAVSRLSFGYGTQPVLTEVSLRVDEGEVVALLGTNGAGKSTLLRLVAGLDHPSRGTIRIFGEDTTFSEAEQVLDLGVALLSGGRMTFPGLSVAENLRVGTQTRYRDAASRRRAEEEAFDAFPQLEARRGQRAGALSGGEQQMLALARVLLLRPRLLLLDELTLGLAPIVVEDLLATVRRLNAGGTTVMLVEQSANLALSLASHALFMERGELRFDGPAADLLTHDELLRPVFLGGT